MILIKNMNNFHVRIKMTSAHEGQAAEEVKVQPWGVNQQGRQNDTSQAERAR